MINVVGLQEKLEVFSENFQKETFLFDLLSIYELPKSTISLLSKNPSKLSGKADQIILKNKVLFHVTTLEEDEHIAIDALQKDKNSYRYKPRFIIVTDFVTLLAVDTKTNETLDIQVKDIGKHYAFFLPWCGMEKSQHVNENPADIRAAYKMDKLYQAIVSDNPEYYREHSHDLNIFLSRLLFCYFAEDTGIFQKEGIFTNLIDSQTSENGDGLQDLFVTLFSVLNTKDSERSGFAAHFLEFPYVNGGLFETEIHLPIFTSSSRKLIIESGKLDWSSINPDIFGSMIQAVVHPGQRENLGMHYTSVPNIMKVIEPLFLNDLCAEFEKSKNDFNKLNKLRERISKIRIFDPACGSGNFLIISYKELCKLEIEIIKRQNEIGTGAISYSGVSLNSFFGIEIDDFAHEVARLSLWLTQHQMNQYFDGMFGILKPTLPLKESGMIACANATRVDWDEVCPRKDQYGNDFEIYVIGNPPYYGARKQEEEQKEDVARLFKGVKNSGNLDYISCWFLLGKNYVERTRNKLAFVTTNSICQGTQVPILWPILLKDDIEIGFIFESFKWKNNAKSNAGVSVMIIGLRARSSGEKYIFSDRTKKLVQDISPYGVSGKTTYVLDRKTNLSNLPFMTYGSMPNDGGNLILSSAEYSEITSQYPDAKKYLRLFLGANELLNGVNKYCIWLNSDNYRAATEIDVLASKVELVRLYRLNSKRVATRKLSSVPYRFGEVRHVDGVAIVVPQTGSERRDYLPLDFCDSNSIVSNAARVIYKADTYLFAILSSKMHILWVKAVAGRLKMDMQYSNTLCYNTFPFPNITDKQKDALTTHVYNILEEREKYPEKTLSELYDPDKMPVGLREAHRYLDQAIDQIYRSKPFESDKERLAYLFKLYEDMITSEAKE